jgi:hypothetical protein
VNELPTLQQANDAGVNALADLAWELLESHLAEPGVSFRDAVWETARDLLRGPVGEDYSRRPGGYYMRPPTHPVIVAIADVGVRLVEMSYGVRDPARALTEAQRLFAQLDGCVVAADAGRTAGPAVGVGATPADAGQTTGPAAVGPVR